MEAAMIGGEDYKVLDECLEEEDTLNTLDHLNQMEVEEENDSQNYIGTEISNNENKQSVAKSLSENITESIDTNDNMQSEAESLSENITESINSNENKQSEAKNVSEDITESINSNENKQTEAEKLSENITESIDTNDNMQSEAESLSENITESINSNENKQTDAEKLSENNICKNQKEITEASITPIDISPSNVETKIPKKIETHWYEKKLTEKLDTIKERMCKLARVLENSYPSYKTWLDYTEKLNGSPLCKLEPPRRWPLDKHHTNRWKFNCSRISVEVSEKGDGSLHSKEKVWQVEPAEAWGVSKHTIPEIPPFVLRAVKIFEDFLQNAQQADEALLSEQFSSDTCIEIDQKNETKPRWLWLIVRCNSSEEIMLFVTGKNISRSTMDHLKQVYESGPGENCNVKSIYCETIFNKSNDTVASNTTFVVGSEVLDEVVGGIKVQLAPKTNFWTNPVGAENVAKTVIELLEPTLKTTVLEVGCGFGLIGLMIASKCRKVIGVDSLSQIEEAEMTCELNNINNASFIVGSSSEVTNVITNVLRNCKASAIINTSTNVGRATDLMICLRKIFSLKRLVMITTLTKQTVRAIIELVRPGNRNMGNPFIPVKAYLVDTLPIGPHFEIVILMERQPMYNQLLFLGALQETSSSNNTELAASLFNKRKINQQKLVDKKTRFNRSKAKLRGKRLHSPERNEGPAKKFDRKSDKTVAKKSRRGDWSRRKSKVEEGSELRINPMNEKKVRENIDRIDLRKKLSNNRIDPEIINKVKEQQAILDAAKEKLSGSSAAVDITTAKELQDMLNMVLEQTNRLQSQLPRSVWDRIAPPDTTGHSTDIKDNQSDPLLKGRYIQEIGTKDILITKENEKFLEIDKEKVIKPMYRKYKNIDPIKPNLFVPLNNDTPILNRSLRKSSEHYHGSDCRKHNFDEISWNKNKDFDKPCWCESSSTRKRTPSPMRKHTSPLRHRLSPSRRFSPKRPLLSPPRRPLSPPRKHISPLRRPISPFRSHNTLIDRSYSPSNRSISGSRRTLTPPRRAFSPLMHQVSPRRHMSPPKQYTSSMRASMTSPRKEMSPIRNQEAIEKIHYLSSSGRRIHSSSLDPQAIYQDILLYQERQQSPMRVESSFRVVSNPMYDLNRHNTPPDEWDIPSRGAIEQSTSHPSNKIPNKSWCDERQSSNSNGNQQASNVNRYRNSTVTQDKWNIKNSSQDNVRISVGEDMWNTKPSSVMQGSKDAWTTNFDNRWSGSSSLSLNNDNWGIQGKESFSSREESLMDKSKSRWTGLRINMDVRDHKGDKDDWDDLPEDAIDPWSDDNSISQKEKRWYIIRKSIGPLHSSEPRIPSSWEREHEMMDSWSNQKDNWQNKGQSAGTSKSLWESNNNQNQRDERWMDISKKSQSPAFHSKNSLGMSWQQQPVLNLQAQRSSTTDHFNPFKTAKNQSECESFLRSQNTPPREYRD